MKNHAWKLGDNCFIVAEHLGRLTIMPAKVLRLSGIDGACATAWAMNEPALGRHMTEEGEPFKTIRAARKSARHTIAERTSWLASKFVPIPLEGSRPAFEIPADMPSLGQIVYIHDIESSEVLEVIVGAVGFNGFEWEAGYDESPGNCEASMIRIGEWWESKETALNGAMRKHYRQFAFVPKEEVARRANERIAKIWSDAEVRLQDPEWNRRHNEAMLQMFGPSRSPVAAG